MKTFRQFFKFSLLALLPLLMNPTSVHAGSDKAAFIFINDDSGAVTDPEKIQDLRQQILAQHMGLKSKSRRFAKAEFIMISTAWARPVFYGKVSDLNSPRAAEVLERSVNDPKQCNQLSGAFEATRNLIVQLGAQGFTEIHISVLSSLISTPVPCGDVKIDLPQMPILVNWAASLDPSGFTRSITFYGVNPVQYPVYAQSMEPLTKRAQERAIAFSIHDVESSLNVLRFGLQGVAQ